MQARNGIMWTGEKTKKIIWDLKQKLENVHVLA